MLARAEFGGGVRCAPIRPMANSARAAGQLDQLYHTTRDVRVRIRALMILLAAERGLVACEIAAIVRQDEETVRRWFAPVRGRGPDRALRCAALGGAAEGHARVPRAPASARAAAAAGFGLPFSLWTAARLADHLAEETGLRMSVPSVHRLLRAGGMALEPAAAHDHQPRSGVRASKKGGRGRARQPEARRGLLLRGRVQHQLAPHPAGDVEPERAGR